MKRFPTFDPERIFMFGDADLDGRLSLEEFLELYRASARTKNAAAAIEPLFRRLDTDHDGFLSLKEYRHSVPKRPAIVNVKSDSAKEKRRGTGDVKAVATAKTPISPEQDKFFESKIRPILANQCGNCHSRTAEKLRGGLRLDSHEGLRRGGISGPVIVPGKPEQSLHIRAIRYHDEELQMPPRPSFPMRSSVTSRPGSRLGCRTQGSTRPAPR